MLYISLTLLFFLIMAAVYVARLRAAKKTLLQTMSEIQQASQKTSSEPHAPDTSLQDLVTHLYNKKHLLQRLQENTARCDRSQKVMAVVLWDIDGFVDFNNRFGQSEGDRFLKKVADTIRRSIRIYDEAFRSGPDEFCALLMPSDQNIAREVTERVSQVIGKKLFDEDREYAKQRFSISSGVAYYPGDGKLPEELLYAANQALYRSKVSRVG